MANRFPTNIRALLIIFVSAAILTSCVPRSNMIYLQDKSKAAIASEFQNFGKTAYRIQTGDQLFVNVNSADKETNKFFKSNIPTIITAEYMAINSYTVSPQGEIDFPATGKIQVRDLTVGEASDMVEEKLDEMMFKDAKVTLKLVNFRVTVLGEVNEPGEFVIDKESLNVFQAIGMAKGMAGFANRAKVVLVRQTPDGSTVHYLDLTDKNILASDHYYLMPNDVLYVEPVKQKAVMDNQRRNFLFGTVLVGVTVLNYLFTTGLFVP